MKHFLTSVMAGAALIAGAWAADAMPATIAAPGADSTLVIPVAGGCGPGYHRNFIGACVPGGFYRPYGYGYGYGPHCFIRETFYGPRRICRY